MRALAILLFCFAGCARPPLPSSSAPERMPLRDLGRALGAALYGDSTRASVWRDTHTLGISVADSVLLTGGARSVEKAHELAAWAWQHDDDREHIRAVTVMFAPNEPGPGEFGTATSGLLYQFTVAQLRGTR